LFGVAVWPPGNSFAHVNKSTSRQAFLLLTCMTVGR